MPAARPTPPVWPIGRRLFGVAALGLFALAILAGAGPTAGANPSDGGVEAESASVALDDRQNDDAFLALARAHWSSLTPAERDAVWRRYEEYQQLPPQAQRRALENFARLLQVRSGTQSDDTGDARLPAWAFGPSLPPDLADRVARMAHDSLFRERMRQLDSRLGDLLRADRDLLRELRSLPPQERMDRLRSLHADWEDARMDATLALIGATPEQAAAVRELDRSRREQERAIVGDVRERMSALNDATRAEVEAILGEGIADPQDVDAATDRVLGLLRGGSRHGHHRGRPGGDSDHRGSSMRAGWALVRAVYGPIREYLAEREIELAGPQREELGRTMMRLTREWIERSQASDTYTPPTDAQVAASVDQLIATMELDPSEAAGLRAELIPAVKSATATAPGTSDRDDERRAPGDHPAETPVRDRR